MGFISDVYSFIQIGLSIYSMFVFLYHNFIPFPYLSYFLFILKSFY